MLVWLLGDAVGPAAVALPVNWAADTLAGLAQRWFQRIRRNDDLSRLVKAATGTSADLTHDESGRQHRRAAAPGAGRRVDQRGHLAAVYDKYVAVARSLRQRTVEVAGAAAADRWDALELTGSRGHLRHDGDELDPYQC